MTVAELIEALRAMPQELVVLTDAYEMGMGQIGKPRLVPVVKAPGGAFGEFDEAIDDDIPILTAVYLPGRLSCRNLDASDEEWEIDQS